MGIILRNKIINSVGLYPIRRIEASGLIECGHCAKETSVAANGCGTSFMANRNSTVSEDA